MSKTAYDAFRAHRWGAKQRGIDFNLTYEQWLSIWTNSGKLPQRGKGAGKYVMARKGDVGPYAVDNVYITSFSDNIRDAVTNGRRNIKKRVAALELQFEIHHNRSLPPVVVSSHTVAEASTYRQAVRLAWQLRRVKGMTQQGLAAEAGLYASHVSDYLNRDDKPTLVVKRGDAAAGQIDAAFAAVVDSLHNWMPGQHGGRGWEPLKLTRVTEPLFDDAGLVGCELVFSTGARYMGQN